MRIFFFWKNFHLTLKQAISLSQIEVKRQMDRFQHLATILDC